MCSEYETLSPAVVAFLTCPDVEHGLGQHVWVAPAGSVPIFLKSLVVAELFYVATTVAIKGSILLSYRRIFQVSYVKKATVVIAAMVCAWALACVGDEPSKARGPCPRSLTTRSRC